MPPKKPARAPKPQDDDDALLDALISKVATASPAASTGSSASSAAAATASAVAGMSQAERREFHRSKKLELERQKELETEKAVEQRLQQQRIQAMIRSLVEQQQMQRPFLSEAITDLSGHCKRTASFDCAWAAMQGWRSSMEDAHVMMPDFGSVFLGKAADEPFGLFAVFDGHAGDQAAKKCAAALPALLAVSAKEAGGDISDWSSVFSAAYKRLDDSLKTKLTDDSGCTAVSCIVTKDHVVCASVGDSRAVLGRRTGEAVALAEDHKPELAGERARIEAAGGHVANNRVNGGLAMSRALGDFTYKRSEHLPHTEQQVTCVPDVITVPRALADEFDFLAVCCDGIFDVMDNQMLVDSIRRELAKFDALHPDQPEQAVRLTCDAICQECLAPPVSPGGGPRRPAGTDNMTIVVIRFRKAA